jgi:hypothetical protein
MIGARVRLYPRPGRIQPARREKSLVRKRSAKRRGNFGVFRFDLNVRKTAAMWVGEGWMRGLSGCIGTSDQEGDRACGGRGGGREGRQRYQGERNGYGVRDSC